MPINTVPTVPVVGTVANKEVAAQQNRDVFARRVADNRANFYKTIAKDYIIAGSLVNFSYLFFKHDPNPLIISAGKSPLGYNYGVNLHYLPYTYIRNLILNSCGKPFSYANNVKNNLLIKRAFRCYKPVGIRLAKLLDCKYIIGLMQRVSSFDPTNTEAMRKYVQEQLRQRTNVTAEELLNRVQGIMNPSVGLPQFSE